MRWPIDSFPINDEEENKEPMLYVLYKVPEPIFQSFQHYARTYQQLKDEERDDRKFQEWKDWFSYAYYVPEEMEIEFY